MIKLNVEVELYDEKFNLLKPKYELLDKEFKTWEEFKNYCSMCFPEFLDKLSENKQLPMYFEIITNYNLVIFNGKAKWFVTIKGI